MKTRIQPVRPRFSRETRFEVRPTFAPVASQDMQRTFEQLKARLLKPVLHKTADPDLRRQLSLAANEAAAVAWTTPYPLLVLPMLLQEKAAEVHQYTLRQEQVQWASEGLFDLRA